MSGKCSVCTGCDDCQTLCELNCEYAGQYADVTLPAIKRDDIIIKKITPDVLNTIADNLTTAAEQGSECNSSP